MNAFLIILVFVIAIFIFFAIHYGKKVDFGEVYSKNFFFYVFFALLAIAFSVIGATIILNGKHDDEISLLWIYLFELAVIAVYAIFLQKSRPKSEE